MHHLCCIGIARRLPCNSVSDACQDTFAEVLFPAIYRQALQRLKRATNQVGHLRILRNRKTFENNHDKKIRKQKESLQRQARARRSRRAAERL